MSMFGNRWPTDSNDGDTVDSQAAQCRSEQYRAAPPPTPICKVDFRVCCSEAGPGDHLAIVGSEAAFGTWDPAVSKVHLGADEGGPWWQGRCALPSDALVEFKFALVSRSGAVRWEDGIENRKIHTQPGTMLLVAHFNYQEVIQKELDRTPLEAKQATTACPTSAGSLEHVALVAPSTSQEDAAQITPSTSRSPEHADSSISQSGSCPEEELDRPHLEVKQATTACPTSMSQEDATQVTPSTSPSPEHDHGGLSQSSTCPEEELEPVPELLTKSSPMSVMTRRPSLSLIPSVSDLGLEQPKASNSFIVVKELASNKMVRVTTASAMGGAAVLGTGSGAAGFVAGGAIGAAAGVVPAFFTFGASIPIFTTIGSGCGWVVGTAVGGAVGLIGGGAVGYRLCSKQSLGVESS